MAVVSVFHTPSLCYFQDSPISFMVTLFLDFVISTESLCEFTQPGTYASPQDTGCGREPRLLNLLLVMGYQNMPALLWRELFCHSDILVPDTKLRRALALGSACLDAMIPLSCCLKVLRLFFPAEEETSISPQAPHSQNSHIWAPGILSFLLETLLQSLCGVVLCRGTFLRLVLYHHPDRLNFLL